MAEIFGKLGEISPAIWATLGLLVVLGLLLLLFGRKIKWNARMLAMGALCIALAFVLSFVRLFRMPQGGSITLASMLPIFMFAFAYGFGPGLIVGVAYGALQMVQDAYFLNVFQVLLDYILAFAALSLCGLFRGWKSYLAFPVGVIVASLARVTMHVLAGVLFFADYAEGSGHGPLVYSILYNMTSVGVDGLICAVLAFLPPVQGLMRQGLMTQKAR